MGTCTKEMSTVKDMCVIKHFVSHTLMIKHQLVLWVLPNERFEYFVLVNISSGARTPPAWIT